jgi:hypothetical protein
MATNGSADVGRDEIQGMITKVRPQRDGTIRFRVTCHDARGRVAHYEDLYLPPKSRFREGLKGGRRAHITFEKDENRPRGTPVKIEFLSQ